MYGKPLISSEIGTGTCYVNEHNQTGIVVPRDDPFAFRQAMDHFWNNPNEVIAMGQRAEARYRELFTGKQMAEAYVELYKKLLGEVKSAED
jgi:rhamnosyl/mannosyltransferase